METPKENIFEEAKRIIDVTIENDVHLKLMGGLATRIHCEVEGFCNREYSDIDVVGLSKEKSSIEDIFSQLGYIPDTRFNALHGHKRLKFEEDIYGRHVDVFLDRFDMDHDWDLSTRLNSEAHTLPLSDLLLMKLQICKINEKDIRDILTMVKDARIGEEEAPHTINLNYIAERCAQDWELYESVLENIKKIGMMLDEYDLSGEKTTIEKRLKKLMKKLIAHPKTAKWKLRAVIGKHRKWCQTVEE